MNQLLNTVDYSVIGAYFALVFVVAIWAVQKSKKKKGYADADDYFLGGRNLGWFVIGASLFSSNIGSEHLVGLAGQGAAGNWVSGQFEILAAFMLILLGWLFVPFYLRTGVYTMPEFLEKRYNPHARKYLTWVSIVGYVLTKISVTIAAGGIVFTALLGIDFWTGAIIIVVLTGLYTIIGGLTAVIYTDTIQMFILIGGAIAVTWLGIDQAGGMESIRATLEPSYFSLWRPFSDPEFPWTGILFGAPILGVWYWCTDQFIVQRVLAAKDLKNARTGSIFAGFLKLLPLFLFVLPGAVAYALSIGPDAVITFPVVNGKEQYDAALPLLITHVLPNGIKGLVIAGLLAALMSSLSSVFNSCSTLFTMDIYRVRKPEAGERELVKVGRIATVVLVALGLLWIPMLNIIEGGLFQKLQSIQAYISPPIAAVFLWGIFSSKINAKGAITALYTGGVLGSLRLILELNKSSLDGMLLYIANINFLHFALILFIICSIVLVAASRGSKERGASELIYNSEVSMQQGDKTSLALTILLILSIGALWIIYA